MPVCPSQKTDTEQNYTVLSKSELLNPVITFFFACSYTTDFKYKREKQNGILQPSCRLCHVSGLCKFILHWGMISLKLMPVYLLNLRKKQAMHQWVSKKKVIYWFQFIKAMFAIPAPFILCWLSPNNRSMWDRSISMSICFSSNKSQGWKKSRIWPFMKEKHWRKLEEFWFCNLPRWSSDLLISWSCSTNYLNILYAGEK